MAKLKNANGPGSAYAFRFNLIGLIILCLCLIAGASFITRKVIDVRQKLAAAPGLNGPATDEGDGASSTEQGPWGELFTQNITLERPTEYFNNELKAVQPPVWTFHGMNVAQVKALFIANGLTQPEAEKALAPDRVSAQGTNTFFKPSDEFVLSLRPETRDRLYGALRELAVNLYLDSPYYYAKNQLEWMKGDARVHPDDLARFKKLIYGGSDVRRFSDYETLMGRIPTLERRVGAAVSLSRQSAVLARLCIRPDADIDKMIMYWGNTSNVRLIDVRPMLEALKRLPRGGTLSLMYLLPPFARERLYTFPSPPAPGAPTPDCHWSTFNFSSVTPENRFLDLAECLRHINHDFYPIARPGLCGDVVLFKNNKGEIRNSAVYLAADLVFSKIGKNYSMPWTIMRIADLQALYSNCSIVYLRNKSD
jgi:hypothetical protein